MTQMTQIPNGGFAAGLPLVPRYLCNLCNLRLN